MALDLSALDAAPLGLGPTGTPVMLPINVLTEDPENPRTAFDATTLSELAEDIRQRGILQPIIVRSMVQGRYVIRFGARRYRAAQIAGLTEVPCFIATDTRQFDSYSQVAENEQRESLSPMELASFVAKRLAVGDKKNVIAQKLNVPLATVTFLSAMIEPPPFLLELYQSGKCISPQNFYQLRKLHEQNPVLVERAVADAAEITRHFVNELIAAVTESKATPSGQSAGSAQLTTTGSTKATKTENLPGTAIVNDNEKVALSSAIKTGYTIIRIKHETRPAQITLTRRASAVGFGWIQYLDDGSESEINLATATLEALLEA